jgi:hypothetical protein
MQVDWYIVTDITEVHAPPSSSQCVSDITLGFYSWKIAKYLNHSILHANRMSWLWHGVALLHSA